MVLHNFPYLKDAKFLKKFDELKVKEQFCKITALNFTDEAPIQEIQGKIVDGNINLDGSSGMRRTANITLIADEYQNDLTNIKNLLSINKKVEILVGFTNTTNQYKDYPILWFPQGIYVINAPSINKGLEGINISLTLHDKMALLNGECGGVLPASVSFHQSQETDEDGNVIINHPTVYQIIQQLVTFFGGQQLSKIIITDIDNRIKTLMKWTGSSPIYLYTKQIAGTTYHEFSLDYEELAKRQSSEGGVIKQFSYGENIGYIFTDFTFPGELIGNAGETVTSILDKIKNVLGNYEYFYDINGYFRFQEVKNYLNTSYSTFLINEMNADNYLTDYVGGKVVYSFDNSNIVTANSVTPQYQQIKNDFLIWGKRKNTNGKEVPIRYHLAIDNKPKVGNKYKVFFYTDPDDNIKKAKKPLIFSSKVNFPVVGEYNEYYLAEDSNIIYQWQGSELKYQETSYKIKNIKTNDYRTELYLSGVVSQPFGLDSNYYYTELKNEWPKIYNIQKSSKADFYQDIIKEPSNLDFFLDILDTTGDISQFNIQNIGRRTEIISDDSINCIFEPNSPDIVLIEAGSETANQMREQCQKRKQEYSQVKTQIYSLLSIGKGYRSAYDEIKKELYQYISYNEQISLTALPIYYLEPNTRISIQDTEIGISGDYMIKTISLPLGINGTMNLSCTKALRRI